MLGAEVKKQELDCLRTKIAKIEERQIFYFDDAKANQNLNSFRNRNENDNQNSNIYTFQDSAIDAALGGGLPFAALTEFRCEETRTIGSASSFAWILAQHAQQILNQTSKGSGPIVWIGEAYTRFEGGELYPPGLENLGIDPSKCLFVQPRCLNDALWAAELCAKETAIAATILEVRGNPAQLDMAGTRRLHLRAQSSGRPVFVVRQSGQAEATAARNRFLVEPASASYKILPSNNMFQQSIHYSAFRITIEKSKNPSPVIFILEWNYDTRSFSVRSDANLAAENHSTSFDIYSDKPQNSGTGISLSAHGQSKTVERGRVLAFG